MQKLCTTTDHNAAQFAKVCKSSSGEIGQQCALVIKIAPLLLFPLNITTSGIDNVPTIFVKLEAE